MHTIVDDMRTSKTSALLQCCFPMKCEHARKIQIAEPGEHIAYGISNAGIDPMIKNKIDDIVDNCRRHSDNRKASKLPFLIILAQEINYPICQFHQSKMDFLATSSYSLSQLFFHCTGDSPAESLQCRSIEHCAFDRSESFLL